MYGYVDFDYVGGLDKRRPQSDYALTMLGYIMSWKSTLQNVVVLSTIEEAIWLSSLVKNFGLDVKGVPILCENQSAIYIAKNLCTMKERNILM